MSVSSCDTLPKLVFRNLVERPAATAMRVKTYGVWQEMTWREVAGQVSTMAAGLLASDLAGDSCLGIIGNNEPELFWAEYAIQSVGRAAVCLYPDLMPNELVAILRSSGVRVIFAEDQEQCDKLLEVAQHIDLKAIIYWDDRGMSDYSDRRIVSLKTLVARGNKLLEENPDVVLSKVREGMTSLSSFTRPGRLEFRKASWDRIDTCSIAPNAGKPPWKRRREQII